MLRVRTQTTKQRKTLNAKIQAAMIGAADAQRVISSIEITHRETLSDVLTSCLKGDRAVQTA